MSSRNFLPRVEWAYSHRHGAYIMSAESMQGLLAQVFADGMVEGRRQLIEHMNMGDDFDDAIAGQPDVPPIAAHAAAEDVAF